LASYSCCSNKTQIDTFYARILYAISDVIVYITKSDSTFEPDLIQVLEWASAAVDKSYNQPSQKTLIIVRNIETTCFQPGVDFTAEKLETLFLRNYGDKLLWEQSEILNDFVTKHNQTAGVGKRIQDNDQLYKALFHNIQCCFIPDKGQADAASSRAEMVFEHLKQLRAKIITAVNEERRLKAEGFALYNVPTMNHILWQCFEHFRKYEFPLDFFKAARRDNPTPRSIEQHIANFLKITFEHASRSGGNTRQTIVDAITLMFLIYVFRAQLPCKSSLSRLVAKALARPSGSVLTRPMQ
jgi:hypothetical protein